MELNTKNTNPKHSMKLILFCKYINSCCYVFKDKKYVLIMVDPDTGEAADVLHWMVTDIEVIITCCRSRPLDKHNLNEKRV